MSMSEEQLQKTGILKKMLDSADYEDDSSLLEKMEIFEDKLDYLNIEEVKKKKLKDLVDKIKEEQDEKVQEFLFKELVKEVQEAKEK